MGKRLPTIIDTMNDPKLFGAWFRSPTWDAWTIFLKAVFALRMTADEFAVYQRHTGRSSDTLVRAVEAWVIAGRRAGKSIIAALILVYTACFKDYRSLLAPGERGVAMCMAADRKQSRVILRYVKAFLRNVPMLARMIVAERAEGVELSNGIDIEVVTGNYRVTRGYTVIIAVCDEIAYWQSEDSANPDSEVVNAVRPAMSTIPGAMLIGISSPYARRGVLWERYRTHFGREGDVLVWQADTRSMNPGVPQAVINRAYEDDPVAAAAEFGAEFRRDIEMLFTAEALEAVTVKDRHVLPPVSGRVYCAAVDPSGGASDSMTLAIAHSEGSRRVLDLVLEKRPPFSPEAVVDEFAKTLAQYGLRSCTGDRYAGEWPRERFEKSGVTYVVSELTASELYRELVPLVNSGNAELLDDERMLRQLARLERRVARGGRESISHPVGAGSHDDVANVAAGALYLAVEVVPIDLANGCFIVGGPYSDVEDTGAGDLMRRMEDEAGRSEAWNGH